MEGAAVVLEGFTDASVILGSGVYALVRKGTVIYVGKSKSVYQRVYTHRTVASRAARGKPIPTWLPLKGFVFDQVFVRPCHIDQLDAVESEMVERYKPKFNESLKSKTMVRHPIDLKIGNVVIPMLARPVAEGIRRI